ncbi:hypothetical protein ES703_42370 [subsurface metagenome]
MVQFELGIAILNLGKHLIESVNEGTYFVLTVLLGPDGIVLLPRNGFCRFRQTQNRIGDHPLQPGRQQQGRA